MGDFAIQILQKDLHIDYAETMYKIRQTFSFYLVDYPIEVCEIGLSKYFRKEDVGCLAWGQCLEEATRLFCTYGNNVGYLDVFTL